MSFEVQFKDANEHGIIVGVRLPKDNKNIPTQAWRQLRKEEQEYAKTLKNRRQVSWIGGRIAAHTAANIIGIDSGAIMTDAYGAPTCSNKLSISISHKSDLAVAIVAKKEHGLLGIDLESHTPVRMGIISKVLREEERIAVQALKEERRWHALLLRFSTKEAIYKALATKQRRHIGFHEALVRPQLDTTSKIELYLQKEPFPKSIAARYIWLENHIITTVQSCW